VYSKDAFGGWTPSILLGEPVNAGRLIGSDVALDAGQMFVGAFRQRYNGVTGGAAYVFAEVPEPTGLFIVLLGIIGIRTSLRREMPR
jgi:hypothetical protein